MSTLVDPPVEAKLVRALGVPGLTANIINTTIGASIFVLPATMAKNLGGTAPLAFVLCALAMALFVTCFALAGSRVSLTGGLYAYVEVAFGRYVGFLAGLLYFTTAILSVAGVVNVLAETFATMLPWSAGAIGRSAIMAVAYGLLAAINIRGVRAGTGAVAIVTIAKLIPLLLFVGVGLFFIKPSALAWSGSLTSKNLGDSVLLLLFAFFGIEVALTPSGEVKDPARTVPRSIYISLGITTVIYILIQLVAQSTLGSRLASNSGSPLAQAAGIFLGKPGRLLLLVGATISSFGFIASDILSSPRILFAFGRDGILPRAFAHVHHRFRSPDVAVIAYAVAAFVLSQISSFESLAVKANVAALLLYFACCAATWQLLRSKVVAEGAPFSFKGARCVPVLAMIVILCILVRATADVLWIAGSVTLVGSLLYFLRIASAKPGHTETVQI